MKNSYPYLGLFVSLCLSLCACSQNSTQKPEPVVKEHSHTLGTTTIGIRQTTYPTTFPIQFVQLHHNELTADAATRTVSEEMGIDYLQIRNNEKRLVDFTLNGKPYRFDPNRMFSKEGIVNSMKLHSRYSEDGFVNISSFRDFILTLLERKKTIVAVHNNTDGDFTIANYKKSKTGLVHQNVSHDPDDFFITTDSLLFTKLKEKDFNVVWENGHLLEDDGSLSIYCSRNEIVYVNVEAEHGHQEQQERMLRTLIEILR
ncbi:MAG: hypothetical protein EOO10_04720 [Chitinophagaceae bacterium]|nr:MAG: hypothetical protein EOO10_04720 [Chitinophagaceae bacterium]